MKTTNNDRDDDRHNHYFLWSLLHRQPVHQCTPTRKAIEKVNAVRHSTHNPHKKKRKKQRRSGGGAALPPIEIPRETPQRNRMVLATDGEDKSECRWHCTKPVHICVETARNFKLGSIPAGQQLESLRLSSLTKSLRDAPLCARRRITSPSRTAPLKPAFRQHQSFRVGLQD